MISSATMSSKATPLYELEEVISSVFGQSRGQQLPYHNLEHTLSVRDHALFLAEREKLNPKEHLILEAAALLHDVGILEGAFDHEMASANYAQKVLPHFGFNFQEISTIRQLILSTRLPQRPTTPAARILCDADLFYLGTTNYPKLCLALRQEWEMSGLYFTPSEWLHNQYRFLSNHRFHTAYGHQFLQPLKEVYLSEIKSKLA